MQTDYRYLIGPISLKLGLDPLLVEAIVWAESRGQAHAYRFEQKYWERYLKDKHEYKIENPKRVSASYGLMQIMYPTARELGFIGEPEMLFVPQTNLRWGSMKLKELIAWAGQFPEADPETQLRAAIASYNGGRGGNSPRDKPLRCDQYAERVFAAMTVLREP